MSVLYENTDEGYMPTRISGSMLFVFLTLFLAVFFLPQFISFYVDWLWFKDAGFENIFTAKLNAQAITAFSGMFAGFVISWLNIWFSMKVTRGRSVVLTSYGQGLPRLDVLKLFDRLKLVAPAGIGIFTGMVVNGNWLKFLYYVNGVNSGYSDPIFGKDISFYLFTLPVYEVIATCCSSFWGVSCYFGSELPVEGRRVSGPKGSRL
jgi:uncharacterized membrane protein (UPF0182 family)